MPATSRHQAERDFYEGLREDLACVSDGDILLSPEAVEGDLRALILNEGDPHELPHTPGLSLFVSFHHRIIEDGEPGCWRVTVDAATFEYETGGGALVLGYYDRLRPGQEEHTPFIRIGRGSLSALASKMQDCAIPAQRMSLEVFLRIGIEYLDVQPVKKNWSEVFERNYRVFEQTRRW